MLSMCMLGMVPGRKGLASLVLVVLGVALASGTAVSFTWIGFWAAMLSNLGVSLRSVLGKQLIVTKEQDPLNFAALLSCGAFVVSLPVAICTQGHNLPTLLSTNTLTAIPLIGFLVWVFNMASILVLSQTSPVTYSMIRSARRPVLIVASMIAFQMTIRPLHAVDIIVAVLGATLYNLPSSGGIPGASFRARPSSDVQPALQPF
eukprot:CAMPEP_0170616848 /NCGR_PEP_ID=MMETSP0224-20130122/26089_1 /TAXON_ID=285029 /ORGANISM="Togula jolla, Strain CCCM 725" /LENGTH=203 /DNA_ID=CAMNT_0010942673 /DNA_START=294 /DNA_END=903 /DNA_ORIENTATION=+